MGMEIFNITNSCGPCITRARDFIYKLLFVSFRLNKALVVNVTNDLVLYSLHS